MLSFRLTLFAAAFAAMPAAAQVRPADAPVLPARTTALGAPAAALSAARPALAACTGPTTVGQAFAAGATFNTAVGNAPPPTGTPPTVTPQELGQSLTAPCDGLLDRFAFVGQTSAANQPVSGRLLVFAGMGTAGTPLSATSFAYSLPAVGAYFFDVQLDPVAVAQGQTVTVFVDLDTPTDDDGNTLTDPFYQQYVTPGTYAGGLMLISTSGSAAGAGTLAAFDLFFTATVSPATTVATPAVTDRAGWRLLSAPVSGVTVADLAAQNLVQGYAGSSPASLYPRQYPEAEPNLFVLYVPGAYIPSSSTADVLAPGAGFFWYFYDRAIAPDPAGFGGGTSQSRDLAGFSLTATGVAATANVDRQLIASGDAFVLLGNPFAAPLRLSGLSLVAGAGTLSTVFQAFDPAGGTYVILGPTDVVTTWQGFFGEVAGADFPTLRYDAAARQPAATVPFYGRPAGEASVRFRLDGQTAAGETHDAAAVVRFLDDALPGRDRHDGSKLVPPDAAHALLAPVAAGERLAVSSLPDVPATVPLAFTATHAGLFTLSWDATPGRPATLRDRVTGDVLDLASTDAYTFASDATGWTERFELTIGRGATAGEAAPAALRVGTFAPNPAAGLSRLTFTSDVAQTVRATVVDALGREVVVLFDAAVTAGAETSLSVEAGRLAPGTYAVRIAGETFTETRRLTVVR